ncbi:MAG: VacB/RNase II family 3'-5' exoribonuclease [Desulfovibrio sp.]|nr:VacB/RNase II family 3'-5' exoribonuclease [Desulfovibrio sp.]
MRKKRFKASKNDAIIPHGTKKNVRIVSIQKRTLLCAEDGKPDITYSLPKGGKKPKPSCIGKTLSILVGKPISQNHYKAYLPQRQPTVKDIERYIKRTFFLPDSFSDAIKEQVERHAQQTPPLSKRRDLRTCHFVTIDGSDARDFDDAIFVQKRKTFWRLSVAIADVTHFVPSAKRKSQENLDTEAYNRGNSFYFPKSVVPMLPNVLSTDLCSLKPFQDRLAIVCDIVLTPHGKVKKWDFYEALIRSHARLTYEEVERVFFEDTPSEVEAFLARPDGEALFAMLKDACALAKIVRNKRLARGSLFFESEEADYQFDTHGRPIVIDFARHTEANNLIEEYMILANEACARFLQEKEVPFLYRVHQEPNQNAMDDLEAKLRLLNPSLLPKEVMKRKRPLSPSDFPALISACNDIPLSHLFTKLFLRAMPKAGYSPVNYGHFGLASEAYCHFTSPIRRYADILVHRALKYCLGTGNDPLPTGKKLEYMAFHLNDQEKTAQECERKTLKHLNCLLLSNALGEVFDAFITSIMSFGVFVSVQGKPIEGLIMREDIAKESDTLDTERQEIRDAKGNVRFRFGDRIRVTLHHVSIKEGHINFVLAKQSS